MTTQANADSNAPARFLIYGATGYTGKLVTDAVVRAGIRPVVAGRNRQRLEALARQYGLQSLCVELNDSDRLDLGLSAIDVVLNAAGPFSLTAEPIVNSCLRTATHYLDVTGEVSVFEDLFLKDSEARQKNIMIMPGAGYAVVPTDCLAAEAVKRLPQIHSLKIGISRSLLVSRGSAKTMIELSADNVLVRRNGALRSIAAGSLSHRFDFGAGLSTSVAVSWPDVFTAHLSTGVKNIETYFESGPMEQAVATVSRYSGWLLQSPASKMLLKAQSEFLPEGPGALARSRHRRTIVLEARNAVDTVVRLRLTTPESYTFTALAVLEIMKKIQRGYIKTGFQTPAQVFGAEFVTQIPGVRLRQLE